MDNASSDVDMVPAEPIDDHDDSGSESADSGTTTPPRSPSPAHHSPIPVDDDPRPSDAELPPSAIAADAAASASDTPAAPATGRGRKSKPSSSNVAAASSGAKPKSTKSAAPRASSPSPPPPPARQPLQTIRLEIKLGGPEDYEVNVSDLAKATGQRPATPVVLETKHDSSDESEGDEDGDAKQRAPVDATAGKRRRVRTLPIVDPSAAMCARGCAYRRCRAVLHAAIKTFCLVAYVCHRRDTMRPSTTTLLIPSSTTRSSPKTSGHSLLRPSRRGSTSRVVRWPYSTSMSPFMATCTRFAHLSLSRPSAKKPKSKKINILAPSASVSAALSTATLPLPALSSAAASHNGVSPSARIKTEESTRDAPISISDGEDNGKLKRKISEAQSVTSISEGGAKKRRKTVEIVSTASLVSPHVLR